MILGKEFNQVSLTALSHSLKLRRWLVLSFKPQSIEMSFVRKIYDSPISFHLYAYNVDVLKQHVMTSSGWLWTPFHPEHFALIGISKKVTCSPNWVLNIPSEALAPNQSGAKHSLYHDPKQTLEIVTGQVGIKPPKASWKTSLWISNIIHTLTT